jgi:hypothetical protein
MRWSKDSWLSKCMEFDKLTHAGGSCLLTLTLYLPLNFFSPCIWIVNAAIAGCLAFTLGLFLEILQGWYADGFSWRDLTANVIGITLAVLGVTL